MKNRRNQWFVVMLIVIVLFSSFGFVPVTLQSCVDVERHTPDLQDHSSMNHQVDGQLGSAMTEVLEKFHLNMSRVSDVHLTKREVELQSRLFGGTYSVFSLFSMSFLMILVLYFSGFYAEWRRIILYIQYSDGEKGFSNVLT